jgi:hypothetical protein
VVAGLVQSPAVLVAVREARPAMVLSVPVTMAMLLMAASRTREKEVNPSLPQSL